MKGCPHCGSHDLRVQTMAVFKFNGKEIDDTELLCEVTENLIMADFEENYVSCADCEWEGKVKDLKDTPQVQQTVPAEVLRLKAKTHDELVAHIRNLENMLHGIENAVDHWEADADGLPASEAVDRLRGLLAIAVGFCPWDTDNEHKSWMIEPRCPHCGWCLNYKKDTGRILHCDNSDCSYCRDDVTGKEGTVEELLGLVDENGQDVEPPKYWLLVQGYERHTEFSFEPTHPSGTLATMGIVLGCFPKLAARAIAAGLNKKIENPELDLYIMPSMDMLANGTFLAKLVKADRIKED